MEVQQTKIRFGIFCDGLKIQAWQAQTINNLLSCSDVELALIITHPNSKDNTEKGLFWNLFKNRYVQKKAKSQKLQELNVHSTLPKINAFLVKYFEYLTLFIQMLIKFVF